MIKLTVQGVLYEFDNERLLLAEAREMKTLTGLTPPRWSVALDEGDADAVAALIFMAKKRAGETLRFSDLDTLDYADIEMEFIGEDEEQEGEGEQPEAAPGADPTGPPPSSGLTPSDGTGAISQPSPTTSSTTPTASTPSPSESSTSSPPQPTS